MMMMTSSSCRKDLLLRRRFIGVSMSPLSFFLMSFFLVVCTYRQSSSRSLLSTRVNTFVWRPRLRLARRDATRHTSLGSLMTTLSPAPSAPMAASLAATGSNASRRR